MLSKYVCKFRLNMCSRVLFCRSFWNKLKSYWKFNNNNNETSETLRCLWPFFRFARGFGMCPVSRVGNSIVVQKIYHTSWYTTWVIVSIQAIMWGNSMARINPLPEGTLNILWIINSITFYTQVLFAGVYMATHTRHIPKYVDRCVKVEGICKAYLDEDSTEKATGLLRDTYILFVSFISAQIIGNALYHTSMAVSYEATTFKEYIDIFYDSYAFTTGNSVSALSYFINLFLVDSGWHFPELFLAMISLLLGRLFARINKVLAKAANLSLAELEKLRSDHREICKLVRAYNNIFGPLILNMYIGNVIYLFTRLYTALGADLKDSKQIVQLEALYAFSYLIFIKILLPTYLAARLHERAHEGVDTIHGWPTITNDPDAREKLLVMGRFVSHMSTGDIGLSGCGFFTITKKFLIKLVGALITYEVIILQFQASELRST